MARFLRYWLPVLAWCAIIFMQSAFATPDVLPHWSHLDKVLHAGVYAFLGLLLYRALNTATRWQGRSLRLIFTATLLTTLYGLSDEWHQSFVADRVSDMADVLADFIGGFIGCCLYILYKRIRTAASVN